MHKKLQKYVIKILFSSDWLLVRIRIDLLPALVGEEMYIRIRGLLRTHISHLLGSELHLSHWDHLSLDPLQTVCLGFVSRK